MKHLILFLILIVASTMATAQTTTNKVLEKDGKIYVQTTTIAEVETTSDAVATKIDQLQAEKAKIETQVKKLDEAIKELQSLYFTIQKKEKFREKGN